MLLSGMTDTAQVDENAALADRALPDSMTGAQLDTIARVLTEFEKSNRVPCTGCGYCMPCPKGINIPGYAVISPDSEKGISYTIKAGIMAVQEQKKLKKSSEVTHHTAEKEEYYMFAVADQPYLKSQSVIKLIDKVIKNTGGKRLAFSLRCGDAVGNPCVFNSSLIPQLLSLEGDKGGRSVAKKHDCVYVDIADERELMDIDTYLIR